MGVSSRHRVLRNGDGSTQRYANAADVKQGARRTLMRTRVCVRFLMLLIREGGLLACGFLSWTPAPESPSASRWAGLLRCASRPLVSTLTGCHPSRARHRHPRVARDGASRGAWRLAGSLAEAIKASPSSRSKQLERVDCATDIAAALPMPGDRGPSFLHAARERARLPNWTALRSRCFATIATRRPDRHPRHPPRPMPGR